MVSREPAPVIIVSVTMQGHSPNQHDVVTRSTSVIMLQPTSLSRYARYCDFLIIDAVYQPQLWSTHVSLSAFLFVSACLSICVSVYITTKECLPLLSLYMLPNMVRG